VVWNTSRLAGGVRGIDDVRGRVRHELTKKKTREEREKKRSKEKESIEMKKNDPDLTTRKGLTVEKKQSRGTAIESLQQGSTEGKGTNREKKNQGPNTYQNGSGSPRRGGPVGKEIRAQKTM